MLLFSTVLDIHDSLTKDAFIQLVIDWNQGSPHANNVIPGIEWHGERNIRFGDDNLWLGIEEYRDKNIIAVRYEKIEENGIIWDSDYVMDFNSMKMSIRLDRSYLEEALTFDPKFSTPHFITLLIEKGYIVDDGDLPVVRDPVIIDESNMYLAVKVINGEKRYKLPVVYVSKTFYDEDPVNVRFLAGRLKGVAHVLVLSGNFLNSRMREACNSKNEYYGAIGVYYPNPAIPHRRNLYHAVAGYDEFLFETIIRSVIQYANAQMVDNLLTWQGVNSEILLAKYSSQKEERILEMKARQKAELEKAAIIQSLGEKEKRMEQKARDEADNWIDSFNNDFEKLQEQVKILSRENEALRYENQGLRNKLNDIDVVPVLKMGLETDLYQGEIKDIVLSILEESLRNTEQRTRRADVVRDIIESNDYQKTSEKKADELKRLLRNYTGMPSRLRQDIEALGFSISEDGKHYKLAYYSDPRYLITLAKTPSDGRSGMNNVTTMIKKVF